MTAPAAPTKPRVGQCIPCHLGDCGRCNDAVSIVGCACPCTLPTEEALSALL